MKKTLLTILILTILAQILVPAYMIWGKYDVLNNGEEIKLRVSPIDPYDAFRGRYVSLWYDDGLSYYESMGKYGILEVGKDGFATVKKVVKQKPADGLYITSNDDEFFNIPLDRYYLEENLAPKVEKMLSTEKEAYVTVRIKNGKSVLSGLYIDGTAVEDVFHGETD